MRVDSTVKRSVGRAAIAALVAAVVLCTALRDVVAATTDGIAPCATCSASPMLGLSSDGHSRQRVWGDVLLWEASAGLLAVGVVAVIVAVRRRRLVDQRRVTASFFDGIKIFSGLWVLATGLLPTVIGIPVTVAVQLHDLRLPLVLAGLLTTQYGFTALVDLIKARDEAAEGAGHA